ncbi:SapC family protein [Alteraurantiacibacter palmitatis]|uniref:SapC family protein n=1 Tax=Alteraurantiacibacter palmitatis TaxID=2054628 RepID=A0ABV7EBK1_9SPHN
MTHALLNNVDHHDLRVITRGAADYGDAVHQVLVFPTEFEAAAREFPIILRPDAEGRLRPVALLGLTDGENLFLDPVDGWQSRHVPLALQRGPFSIAAPEAEGAEPMIRIDLADPRVSRSEGEAVFLPHGGQTRYLERISNVLRAIYLGHDLLDPLVEALTKAGLLRQVNLELRTAEDEIIAISNAVTIDRERLAALSGAELEALHRPGFLHSAFFIAASLDNLQRLVDLRSARRAALSEKVPA